MRDLFKKLQSLSAEDRLKYIKYSMVSVPSIPEDYYLLHLDMLYSKIEEINSINVEKQSKKAIEKQLKVSNSYEGSRFIKSFEEAFPKKSKKTDFKYEEAFECSLELLEEIETKLFEVAGIEVSWKSEFQTELLSNPKFLKHISGESRTKLLNEILSVKKPYKTVSKLLNKIKGDYIDTEVVDSLTNATDILERNKICLFLKDQDFDKDAVKGLLEKAILEQNIAKVLNLKRILGNFYFRGASENSEFHHLWNKNNKTISLSEELAILEAEENGTLFSMLKENPRLLIYLILFEVPFTENPIEENADLYKVALDYFVNNIQTEQVLKDKLSELNYSSRLSDFFADLGFAGEFSLIRSVVGYGVFDDYRLKWIFDINGLVSELNKIGDYDSILELNEKLNASFNSESNAIVAKIKKELNSYKYKVVTTEGYLEELFSTKGPAEYAFIKAQYLEGDRNAINRFMNYFYHLTRSAKIKKRKQDLGIYISEHYYDYRKNALQEDLLMRGLIDSLKFITTEDESYIIPITIFFFNMYGEFILTDPSTKKHYDEFVSEQILDFISEEQLEYLLNNRDIPLQQKNDNKPSFLQILKDFLK